MKSRRISFFAVIVACVFCGVAGAQTSAPPAAKQTRTETMLKEIAVEYTRPVPTELAFFVPYAGKEMKSIPVLVIEAEGAVVVSARIAADKELNLNLGIMRKLLEYNMNADYIKVGISDEGMIEVQVEQDLNAITSGTLQKLMDQVAAGADDVAKILAPARKKAAAK